MSYRYENELLADINRVKNDLGFTTYNFIVEEEQMFIKRKDIDPNTIYVVIKYLASDISVNEKTQPVQLLILSEQNQLEIARMTFQELANRYNFTVYKDSGSGTYVKYQYTDPVVLSNFNGVSYGYRSVLYLTVTLRIMENVVDLGYTDSEEVYHPGCICIGTEILKPLSFSLSYSMTPNSQQLASKNIASSEKSVSNFALTVGFDMIQSTFLSNLLLTMNETNTGNEAYAVSFEVGATAIQKNLKIISIAMVFTPGGFPELRVGLME